MQLKVRTRIESTGVPGICIYSRPMPDSRCSVGVAARLGQYEGNHQWPVVMECRVVRIPYLVVTLVSMIVCLIMDD